MERVDSSSALKYKDRVRKQLHRFRKENPLIPKSEAIKKHKGDPVIANYHPLRYFGSISEKIDEELSSYIDNDSLRKKVEDLGQAAPRQKYKPI